VKNESAAVPVARYQPLAEALIRALLTNGSFTLEELGKATARVDESFGEHAAGNMSRSTHACSR
jgi:hypothetical protein